MMKQPNPPITKRSVAETYQHRPRVWIYSGMIVAILIGAFLYSVISMDLQFQQRDVWDLFVRMFRGLLQPNVDFLLGRGEFFSGENGVPYLIMQTFAIAFIGTTIASILGIPIAFLTARNVSGKVGSKIGEVLLILIRTFPEILMALILVRVTGFGAITGIVVIGIHSIGMVGKLFAESIENMDRGPLEALDAVGANTMQKIRYGILPQVLPEFMSIALYRLDINIRSATVLGVVSAGGIGANLIFATTYWNWGDLSSILIAIIIMITVVDTVSSRLRKKLI
jgi:phosphonate transport system permease protein